MTNRAIVNRLADAQQVAGAAADAFIKRVSELLESQDEVHVQITGGSVGIATLASIAAHPELDSVDFGRVHIWWGDERYVAGDSPDRNSGQADRALLSKIKLPAANRHEFPNSDSGWSLDEAASQFAKHFNEIAPQFDIAFVGMGPDGHVCSLFPGSPIPAAGAVVHAEHDSPKPPPQRLTFTYQVMNSVTEIWFVVAGADKSSAVATAFSAERESLPVGRIKGREKTIWFIDSTASTEILGC